jgi:hypothetical protein
VCPLPILRTVARTVLATGCHPRARPPLIGADAEDPRFARLAACGKGGGIEPVVQERGAVEGAGVSPARYPRARLRAGFFSHGSTRSRHSSTPDGWRALALAAVNYQDIPAAGRGRPMGKKPLTPAQRERRRASQKRWEEEHREKRRAYLKRWRDDHREQRLAYFKRWRAENSNQVKRRLRARAPKKKSKPEAAE